MAAIAHEVMVEAERAFRRADALSAGMEPYLLKRVTDSAIYAYTNDRPDRNVPPGDVLLAAALAAGISLDHKLGVDRGARDRDVDDLRAEMAEMRAEVASLRAELSGRSGAPTGEGEPMSEAQAARQERAAQRRAWAARSGAGAPAGQVPPAARPGGRSMGS